MFLVLFLLSKSFHNNKNKNENTSKASTDAASTRHRL